MLAVKISLNSIDKVKSFVNDISGFNAEFDLVSGRYVIDAKSIMGVIAMGAGYNTQLTLRVEGPDESEAAEVIEELFNSKFEEE